MTQEDTGSLYGNEARPLLGLLPADGGQKAMTLEHAIKSDIRIQPGRKIRTFGGWCRQDLVLFHGREIGKIQTRRARDYTETITSVGGVFVPGYQIDWLMRLWEECVD